MKQVRFRSTWLHSLDHSKMTALAKISCQTRPHIAKCRLHQPQLTRRRQHQLIRQFQNQPYDQYRNVLFFFSLIIFFFHYSQTKIKTKPTIFDSLTTNNNNKHYIILCYLYRRQYWMVMWKTAGRRLAIAPWLWATRWMWACRRASARCLAGTSMTFAFTTTAPAIVSTSASIALAFAATLMAMVILRK